jgi:hypothetical protein
MGFGLIKILKIIFLFIYGSFRQINVAKIAEALETKISG